MASSAPGGLRRDLRPARPAQHHLRRPYRQPLSSSNNSSNNTDFHNYGAGDEIALDIEWAHAMAPAASIVVLSATPDSANYSEDIPQGIATLAGLPGVSVVSASYGVYLDDLRPGGAASRASTARSSSRRGRPPERELLRVVGRRRGGLRGGLPVGLARGRVGRRHQPVSQRTMARTAARPAGASRNLRRQRRRLQPGVPDALVPAERRVRRQRRRRAPSPTSPPTPTRTPAWPSTTLTISAP